jgi:phosphate ABC transporter permease protein PstC
MRAPWSDDRAERTLGAVACVVLLIILGMVAFVFAKAWPSFSHNGLSWFGPPAKGTVDDQLGNIFNSPADPKHYVYELGAWPLIYGTLLTTFGAVAVGLVISLLAAIFIVEFAPPRLARLMQPVVRLLAAVPSVVYGLIGILVLVPFVGNHVTSRERKQSVLYVVQLTGSSLLVALIILTVMIVPIMVAIMTDALRATPRGWTEGSAALGVNRWRTVWTISVRAARPALIAATVRATARALGEAIMISMVSGGNSFAPKPIDGLVFLFEPLRTLASGIVDYHEGIGAPALGASLYAWALLLLFAALVLSVGGYLIKLPLRKYQVRG